MPMTCISFFQDHIQIFKRFVQIFEWFVLLSGLQVWVFCHLYCVALHGLIGSHKDPTLHVGR